MWCRAQPAPAPPQLLSTSPFPSPCERTPPAPERFFPIDAARTRPRAAPRLLRSRPRVTQSACSPGGMPVTASMGSAADRQAGEQAAPVARCEWRHSVRGGVGGGARLHLTGWRPQLLTQVGRGRRGTHLQRGSRDVVALPTRRGRLTCRCCACTVSACRRCTCRCHRPGQCNGRARAAAARAGGRASMLAPLSGLPSPAWAAAAARAPRRRAARRVVAGRACTGTSRS